MHLLGGTIVVSASDLAESLSCEHLTALNLSAAGGTTTKPPREEGSAAVLARRGDDHEQRYLQALLDAGKSVVEVPRGESSSDGLYAAEAATLEAMRTGADIIYQATFFDGRWRGHADFLDRVEVPSNLGPFSYEVVDTKLARHAKPEAILQISNYSQHVARLQGVLAENMHLVYGDNTRATFRVKDFDAYYRTIKRRFETMIDEGIDIADTYPDPVAHCTVCDWVDQCVARRVEDDHLSLVAGMGRHQVARLKAHGITTVAELGTKVPLSTPGIGSRTLQKLHDQARMQLSQRDSGTPGYELLPPAQPGLGFSSMPLPSPGDLFFDMEGDPYVGTHGIEYLFGVTEQVDGELTFTPFWGHDEAGEKKAFEDFIDFVMQRMSVDPNLHIYHYAPYEVTAMKKLSGRYGTREIEVDQLLRGEVFVDLYRVVRQSIRISQDSYSIKKLEPFYMEARETEVKSGGASIDSYEEWIETKDQKILDDIEAYNRDDCDSTLKLRNWLEGLRTEAEAKFGELPRQEVAEKEASDSVRELDERIVAVELQLQALVATDTDEDRDAKTLLGHLLEWHRRESKAEWWRFYELCQMGDPELFDDRDALSGLTYEGVVDKNKSSSIHRYRFDPSQDHKITMENPMDPRTGKGAGTVHFLDDEAGIIDLKRGDRNKCPEPTALIPPGPISHKAQQEALIEIGQTIADGGFSASEFRAAQDLLLRNAPRLKSGQTIEQVVSSASDSTSAAIVLVQNLDSSSLAIQGPPGSGKTYTGAEVILALVKSGKKVGITASSHKVIGNVLDAVVKHGAKANVDVRIMQKADKDKDKFDAPGISHAGNSDIDDALAGGEVDLVAGTAWLFARAEMREALDVLIIDEAGQMSLANVLAVSTAAKSIVLLGDPQQLDQPSKGVHPDGADASALGHLLGEHQTVPDNLGLLLDTSWRMHPDVCGYISDAFYDSRLTAQPTCSQQTVAGVGTGLRLLTVEHEHNKTSSIEEGNAIAEAMTDLLGKDWTDRDGNTRPLTVRDILIVTPYNAQVMTLQRLQPDGARIGTVDKFQGQEAAVVFYSMCASSSDDISRGMEFLYSHNRLNVAISRAQCLAYLVCSPELLTIACRNADQMRLANALCAFAEAADR